MRKTLMLGALAAVAVAVGGFAYTSSERSPAQQAQVAQTQNAASVQTAQSEVPQLYPDDRIMGSADAPITMIEYASMTCSHCATFHTTTLPQIKSEYIDKGLVKLVYRDYPLDARALQGALLAQCVPPERFFGLVDVLFKTQQQWSGAPDAQAALTQIGGLAGLDKPAVEQCLANNDVKARLLTRRQEAEAKYQIQSTPTFVINGRRVAGALPFAEFDRTFKELLPKG